MFLFTMDLLVEDEKITTAIDPYYLPILSFSSG
jgi:hypothetical protein